MKENKTRSNLNLALLAISKEVSEKVWSAGFSPQYVVQTKICTQIYARDYDF